MLFYRAVSAAVCCVAGVAVASCSDQLQEATPTPSFAVNSTNDCAPNVFNPLISQYFSDPTQAQRARGYKDLMVTALPSDSGLARTNGFNLMEEIAVAAKAGATSFSTGSELTRETLKCIFDVTDAVNVVTGFGTLSFEASLNYFGGGGYDVRPAISDEDDDSPVLALKPGMTDQYLSGVALPPDADAAHDTWTEVASERVLIYGFPGPQSPTPSYDWSAIPRRTTFNPSVVVGLCIEDGANLMLEQANLGLLSFEDASYFLGGANPGQPCSGPLASTTRSGGIFALGRLLRQWGSTAFGVQPLQAAMVSPGQLGGNAGSLKSLFDDELVNSVTLAFRDQPRDAFVDQEIPPPITVTALSNTQQPAAGVQVKLILTTNNGKTVMPLNNVATTEIELDSEGQPIAVARFTGMSVNKSGGYSAQIDLGGSTVLGRRGIQVTAPVPLSRKFNVRPSK